MKTSRFTKSIASGAMIAIAISISAISVQTASAQAISGAAQLRALMNTHVYHGQRITQAVKNATGDPNIVVIDRRHTFGETYRCSYTYRGNPRYRILVCD